MKHRVCLTTACQYYLHEDTAMIYCLGFKSGITLHVAFANRTDAKEYKTNVCRNAQACYKCPIHIMLTEELSKNEEI